MSQQNTTRRFASGIFAAYTGQDKGRVNLDYFRKNPCYPIGTSTLIGLMKINGSKKKFKRFL
jgi:hypothetical protein